MPSEPTENGERKTFNRRARTGWAAMALATAAFYICMILKLDIEWFKVYGIFVGAVTGFIIGGISVTDGISAWKK
jgi:hypothetical protein